MAAGWTDAQLVDVGVAWMTMHDVKKRSVKEMVGAVSRDVAKLRLSRERDRRVELALKGNITAALEDGVDRLPLARAEWSKVGVTDVVKWTKFPGSVFNTYELVTLRGTLRLSSTEFGQYTKLVQLVGQRLFTPMRTPKNAQAAWIPRMAALSAFAEVDAEHETPSEIVYGWLDQLFRAYSQPMEVPIENRVEAFNGERSDQQPILIEGRAHIRSSWLLTWLGMNGYRDLRRDEISQLVRDAGGSTRGVVAIPGSTTRSWAFPWPPPVD